MAKSQPTVPGWLHMSHSPTHLATAIRTLHQRERTRASARSASRHQSHPSRAHRITHLPSSLTNKSDHVKYYSVSVGSDPDNQPCNRYSDIEPYDRTRVVVAEGDLEKGDSATQRGRYLNASWVRERAGGKWWIATQAPLPNTSHAYLCLILYPIQCPTSTMPGSRVRTVVQLTRNFEAGMRKAHVYFPPLPGQSWLVEPEPACRDSTPAIEVTLLSTRAFDDAHCEQSTVSLQAIDPATQERIGEPVIFQHMLFSAWPDFGVPRPEDRASLLRFVKLVDDTNRDVSSLPQPETLDPSPPIMVNCSAGVGRTGAFIALSSLLRAHGFLAPDPGEVVPLPSSPLGPLPDEIADDLVAQEIDSLREQRPAMVQKEGQILLVYELLSTAFAVDTQGPNEAG
ncbi:phosphatases II [Obba rivulosa]|uniref:Phosphatases II n=1 Tax=Obba rivulosa TaxID=1052685 RepID=A0A8E2DH38_9APHY|nr:phosphatases II [Obba rivulosa]